jgi:pimeloyl-ACP methyl ester carboxylesterase
MQNFSYLKWLFTSLILLVLLPGKAQQYLKQDSVRTDFMMKVIQKNPRTQIPKPPYRYSVEDIEFDDAGTGLHYGATLTKPLGKTSFPTVVLISGTGPQDRDYTGAGHKAFWVLADYLSNHGIGVLRMDDRSKGRTNGMYMLASTMDFAKDAYAGIKWLYGRKDIDTSRIGLVGHSEGGIIGPIVSKMEPNAVKFMVLISGPTVGLRVVNRLQTHVYFDDFFKHNDTLTNAYMRLHTYVVDRIPAEASDYESLKVLLDKAADTFYRREEPAVSARLRVAEGENGGKMLMSSFGVFIKPWWQFILPYDPVQDLVALKCPVLGIYGDKDQQVPPMESMKLLKDNLPANKYNKVLMYKNMNHFMQPDAVGDPKKYESIAVTVMLEVMEQMVKWINSLPVKVKK